MQKNINKKNFLAHDTSFKDLISIGEIINDANIKKRYYENYFIL
jgi:hypothetical protein